MSEQNKVLTRRLVEEVWNQGNYAVVDELVAGDYLGHSTAPETETHGRQGYREFYTTLRQAFPDIQFTIKDQIAEGDRVVTRWTARGTHQGKFQGIPPSGQHGEITGISIDRIAAGKVVECWTNADDLGLMRLLGVLPAPQQAVAPMAGKEKVR
ncbi:MAG TPA: ester cyclase [Candidatus Sulfomarinibacteraceae bacterium]|nr:ester cyclase [Candidatus Sulfomarinibacteraceae bacterium]